MNVRSARPCAYSIRSHQPGSTVSRSIQTSLLLATTLAVSCTIDSHHTGQESPSTSTVYGGLTYGGTEYGGGGGGSDAGGGGGGSDAGGGGGGSDAGGGGGGSDAGGGVVKWRGGGSVKACLGGPAGVLLPNRFVSCYCEQLVKDCGQDTTCTTCNNPRFQDCARTTWFSSFSYIFGDCYVDELLSCQQYCQQNCSSSCAM
jgi:hypothetical protein